MPYAPDRSNRNKKKSSHGPKKGERHKTLSKPTCDVLPQGLCNYANVDLFSYSLLP
jgi:hypothetical protein